MIKSIALGTALMMSAPVFAAELTLSIQGINSSQGNVTVSLYDKESAFSKQTAIGAVVLTSQDTRQGSMKFVFSNLKAGSYAAFVHHDKNNDATFNMKGNKMLEGYGFTNNVGKTKTPSFNEAKLKVGGNTQQTIQMIYSN